jgi:hypothetical protein
MHTGIQPQSPLPHTHHYYPCSLRWTNRPPKNLLADDFWSVLAPPFTTDNHRLQGAYYISNGSSSKIWKIFQDLFKFTTYSLVRSYIPRAARTGLTPSHEDGAIKRMNSVANPLCPSFTSAVKKIINRRGRRGTQRLRGEAQPPSMDQPKVQSLVPY